MISLHYVTFLFCCFILGFSVQRAIDSLKTQPIAATIFLLFVGIDLIVQCFNHFIRCAP